MKLLKNKTIIGIIAIVFGILICFILTLLYTKSLEAKTKVIQIDKSIEKGMLIEEDDIKVVEVGSYNLPDDVIRSKNEVIGKYAAIEMYPSEYIIPKKLFSSPLSKDEYLMDLDGTKSAVSITLQSFAAGLSGKLLSGDIVSIITTDSNTNETHIPEELKYVKVLASTTAKGNDVKEDTKNKEDTEEETLQPCMENNYQDLADWYAELSYTWLRIRKYADKKDVTKTYIWGIMLQEELNRVCSDFGID
ncbi:Flp pilus assembly protein CpaB [Anaerocolumna sp. MB42-C2]|uniref:Flp pilus assembly protein CpaB n=1 Tax=Anaerocolumna sp. MB42-C2 TaxID=3070997 RepID=UPI0027DFC820|nr:SAF domain-containing protein [Anaerocolumna sp. MB42-C2]WMJ88559.1 SAF domain-containing protein [Anaerocolumna sp. MB42-C2]